MKDKDGWKFLVLKVSSINILDTVYTQFCIIQLHITYICTYR